ncbi:hypothetical protein CVS40_12864 [Lucilia cuprina]|nr:hypothetical protein CVS40_12864 [Lucilia cuprina]
MSSMSKHVEMPDLFPKSFDSAPLCGGKKELCGTCQTGFSRSQSDDELKAMENFKNVSFICSSCKKNPPSVVNLMRGEEDCSSFKQTLKDIVAEFKRELSTCISDLKSDVHIDSSTSSKIAQLEIENNSLYRKFNRSDLIILGLPVGVADLAAVVAEFNNVTIRNEIMNTSNPNRGNSDNTGSSAIDGTVSGDTNVRFDGIRIEKRVFLNDHYTPVAG